MKEFSLRERLIALLCAAGVMIPFGRAAAEDFNQPWPGDRILILALFIGIGVLTCWRKP